MGISASSTGISDGSVTTAKLADGAVTSAKIKNFVAVVTSLPTSPVNGDICFFQNAAMATQDIRWQLQYDSGTSRWQFVGGQPLRVEQVGGHVYGTTEGTTSLNHTTLATAGPAVIAPLTGKYLVEGHATVRSSGVAALLSIIVWVTGDSTTIAWDSGDAWDLSAVNNGGTIVAKRTATATAGNSIELRYAVSNASCTGLYNNRSIYVTPVYVS